jgi:hypothetical protein
LFHADSWRAIVPARREMLPLRRASVPTKGDKIVSRTNFILGARLLLGFGLLVVAAGPHGQAAEPEKPLPTSEELAKLAAVIKPSAAASKWQQIPWLTDVNEARKLAKDEKRPLFLWTVFGEPLDEC